MSRILAAVAAAALGAAGCAQNYATTLPPSGEPLAYDWSSFRQGSSPIDEQDFYRIAGDADAEASISRTRARGVFYNRAGWILAAIGGVALVTATQVGDGGLRKTAYGLTLALPIGGTMAFYGQHVAERHPQLSGRRAQETANRYNAHLAVGSVP
jgi:hypothetical protein